MKLPSGGDLKSALKRGPVELEPDGVYGGCTLFGVERVSLTGNGATIRGALKFEDCGPMVVQDIQVRDSPTHGVFIAKARGLEFRRVMVENSAKNGILTTRVYQARFMDCGGSRNALHGLYLSEAGGNYTVSGGAYTENQRCGIQVNARPGGARGLRVSGANCLNNPTAGIQLAGVTDVVLEENDVAGGRFGVVVWCDNGGGPYGCRNVDLVRQPGTIQMCRHSRDVRYARGARVERTG